MKFFFIAINILISYTLFAQNEKKLPSNYANAIIYRDGYFARMIKNSFYLNDSFVGKIRGGQYLNLEIKSGRNLIGAIADNKTLIEVEAENQDTILIVAKLKGGYPKGNIELTNIPCRTNIYYDYIEKIKKSTQIHYSEEDLLKENAKYYSSINKTTIESTEKKIHKITVSKKNLIAKSPIILEYNLLDFPFSNNSMNMSGISGLFSNPSMNQSLNIVSSVSNLMRDGTYRLMQKNDTRKRFYFSASVISDFLLYIPIPLTSGWLHEEFHRAVLTKHEYHSYNEMNSFPIFKSLISVMHVKDEDLINLKKESPQDMTRLAAAGIEGENLLSNRINRDAFFFNKKSISILPFLSSLNSCIYIMMCSSSNIDKMNDKELTNEGVNVRKRDILGLDFLSFTYDLYHPNEPYINRGLHPSGVGIKRYIKRAQLNSQELKYLKTQGYLHLINLINPISFHINSFNINSDNNSSMRANMYLNHWLTSFGYNISATLLLNKNSNNYAFSLHNYVNYYKWLPGLEAEILNYEIAFAKFKNPFYLSGRAMLWLQPENLLYFDKKDKAGGMIELSGYMPISKKLYSFATFKAKSSGWVAGNEYLSSTVNAGFGLRAVF